MKLYALEDSTDSADDNSSSDDNNSNADKIDGKSKQKEKTCNRRLQAFFYYVFLFIVRGLLFAFITFLY